MRSRPNTPLFALEHGLCNDEIEALRAAIRQHISTDRPDRNHWLAWVVYSSELGYSYAGEEYWQTFERDTPGFEIGGSDYRNTIKSAFESFARQLRGAKPSGRWADQFSIICWPITHAILPVDLQRQLARVLFDLRYQFSREILSSPEILGRTISSVASSSFHVSSRFKNFAENPTLVGQIATALLFHNDTATQNLLTPDVLTRITTDLHKEHQAKLWLSDAQSRASKVTRIQIQGPQLPRMLPPGSGTLDLDLEYRIILQKYSNNWCPILEVPSLSPLLRRFPDFQASLVESRCFIQCGSDRPIARERLLHGTQRIPIRVWPADGVCLLRFEKTSRDLEFILSNFFTFRSNQVELFKITVDSGVAYRVQTRLVQPGGHYLVLSNDPAVYSRSLVQHVQIDVVGIKGAYLRMPEHITAADALELQRLGLQACGRIRVWSVGLSSSSESDSLEWIAGEVPIVGVSVDQDVVDVSLRLDGHQELSLGSSRPGQNAFVELCDLGPGKHTLIVNTTPYAAVAPIPPVVLDVAVRDPRDWDPGREPQGLIYVDVSPVRPTLEQLWQGEASIHILGPRGHAIRCKCVLYENEGGKDGATLTVALPDLELPCSPEKWRSYFERCLVERGDAESLYDTARFAVVELESQMAGRIDLRFERRFGPLRWSIIRTPNEWKLKLHNDTGLDVDRIVYFSYDVPNDPKLLSPPIHSEIKVPLSGGLYKAVAGDPTCDVMLPIPPITKTFAALGKWPKPRPVQRDKHQLIQLLKVIEIWFHARIPGSPVATMMRRKAVLSLIRTLFEAICGSQWVEPGSLEPGTDLSNLFARTLNNQDRRALDAALTIRFEGLAHADFHERLLALRRTIDQYGSLSVNDAWYYEFALRLAACPWSVRKWAGDRCGDGIEFLINSRVVAMAARFMVLTIDSMPSPDSGDRFVLYSNWGHCE